MIEKIFVISMLCSGVHLLTRENGLFSFWQRIANDIEQEIRSELFNPVSECLACMSTFWTCVYLGLTQEVIIDVSLLFLATFFFLIGIDVSFGKMMSKIAKVLYFGLIIGFLYQTSSLILSLVLLFCVNGLNTIIGKVLSLIDDIMMRKDF